MAVEAGHLNLFPPQLITNRNLLNSNAGNAGTYNTQMGFGMPFTGTLHESLLPFPQSLVCDSVPVKTSVKAESGVTYNVPVAPRKRSRDSFNQISNFTVPQENNNNNNNLSELSSLLGRDIPLQIHQQQLEIDHIVAEHTNKIIVELEEKQKQHARLLVSAIGDGVMKKMKEKDEQIQRMGKLNWVLQERVKSLYVENQLWRDLAQTNEAAANSLRSHLEQVLAHVSDDRPSIVGCGGGAAAEEDAESCCGSNDYGRDGEEVEVVGRRMLAVEGGDKVAVGGSSSGGGGKRLCKKCGERESCVLVLPCRHLCLCTPCGSKYHHTCPVCNSYMNASVNVNLS
ncbi:unnamed protein product [Camellia sinensis]